MLRPVTPPEQRQSLGDAYRVEAEIVLAKAPGYNTAEGRRTIAWSVFLKGSGQLPPG